MKKKIIIAACAAAIIATFTGCASNTSTKISSSVAMANPWEEYKTLDEAKEAVGFEITLPEAWSDADDAVYRVCAGLNEIEVQINDGEDLVRKAKDDGDISGDYNEYASEEKVTVGDVTATFKGEDKDSVSLAVWTSGDYSYSISLSDAVSADEMQKLVEALK